MQQQSRRLEMGIIAKQASSNAALTLTGTIFGAINTIIVLPLAFAEFKSGWGVLRFILSWAVIFSQLFSFGANSVIINFLPKFSDSKERSQLMRYVLILSLIGIGILLLLTLLGKDFFLSYAPAENRELISEHIPHLLLLTSSLILAYVFGAFSIAGLKTTRFILLNDPFLKGAYLLLALLYFFKLISFEALMWGFIGSYAIVALIFYITGKREGMTFKAGLSKEHKQGALNYGLYSILDKGAQTITQNLDIIMIGMMLQLDTVAEYIIAFFIGSVVLIPFRSINTIAGPIISKAISADNREEMEMVNRQTAFFSLLTGGFIFACVWVCAFQIFDLLPEKFAGGEYVVLFIGSARLMTALAGMSGAIILYSVHYRLNLYLNIGLIVLTILTNLLLIPKYGINGAAAATAISAAVFALARILVVQFKFKLHPFSKQIAVTLLAIGVCVILFQFVSFDWAPLLTIIVKCLCCGVIFLAAAASMGVLKELKGMVKGKLGS